MDSVDRLGRGSGPRTVRRDVDLLRKRVAIIADPANWTLENPSNNQFEDVPVGSTYFQVIQTAVSHGVLVGYPCGAAPAGPCVPPANKPYFLPAVMRAERK